MIRNLRELYQYRGLLLNLTERELRARYRGSVLGFLWTFLNPTLLMGVYALVYGFTMKQQISHYTYFVFVGLLPWIWFSSSIGGGASAISDRRDLLTKVHFPAQVLPATVVATNLCNYVFSLPLMVGLGLVFGDIPSQHALALPLVVAVQLLFTTAVTFILSALNVAFRDLQHIVGNLLTLWFFLTPIIYLATTFPERWRKYFVWGNPMAVLITSYQAIFYEHRWPDPRPLLMVALLSAALFWIAATVFESRREEFAERA